MKRRTEEGAPRAFNRALTTLVDSPLYILLDYKRWWLGAVWRYGDMVLGVTDDRTRDFSGPMAAAPINAMCEQLSFLSLHDLFGAGTGDLR